MAAVVCVGREPGQWIEAIRSLGRVTGISKIIVTVSCEPEKARGLEGDRVQIRKGVSAQSLIDELVMEEKYNQVLLVTEPVVLSKDALEIATEWVARDARVATVSFLSNSAGYLSFPYRNTEHPVGPPGYNEMTLTRRLRTLPPMIEPVPISVPEGGAILLGASAVNTAGGFNEAFHDNPRIQVVEFALRASRRGFLSYLDANTYISLPWDGTNFQGSTLENQDVREKLISRFSFFPGLYEHERSPATTPLSESLDLARAKAEGLRILIDGACLGPMEMGTQLLIMALSQALARQEGVKWIGVGVPNPGALPNYAQKLFTNPKIALLSVGELTFPGAPQVDILHRPYQPNAPIPWERWRNLARRSVITIQDLIAYRNGSYFFSAQDWKTYREELAKASAQCDGIVSISHDVVHSITEERLKIPNDRLYVVENGIDYRSGDQPVIVPTIVAERGLTAKPFLFLLGATYSHKNRDLAIRVWQKLVDRGHDLALIMAGATVPCGSTRLEEAALVRTKDEDDFLVLPDVSAEERNWLLKHSSLVMYPTSAEGFGQMPFEAARFNKPSLYVAFGPLKELIDDDAAPTVWDLDLLTDRAEKLITDPLAAQSAVKNALQNLSGLSWDETARKTVELYFDLLSKPALH
ncbi:glycosyltransferase [Asticcacaulis taihuensis]|uniref:Glycosyltransferase involved in cell wall bisynthesis n=1 Tax=Asticcacaulis taihuensis TaxID=260084 RepID=A0A1G4SEJ4_9CAUL|nr:Glycosyltransferase involved in cell wall bisynthesis [Asticcacaulis taihuensis]